MQKDMHFYGVYALARAAGIKQPLACTIACASQFVDDALEGKEAVLGGKLSAILPVMTSHRPIDYQNSLPGDQWKVWVAFHFLPGNSPDGESFYDRMVCAKDSAPANAMLQWALSHKNQPLSPHLAGIAAHVYADTFSHWGFLGLNSVWNKVKIDTIKINCTSPSLHDYLWNKFDQFSMKTLGTLADAMPVGHGAVGTFPDRPYLNWQFDYESSSRISKRTKVRRNNLDDYLEACEKLFGFFRQYAALNPGHANGTAVEWGSIKDRVLKILKTEKPEQERIDAWMKAIGSGDLFKHMKDDKAVTYSENAWSPKTMTRSSVSCADPSGSDACLFVKSASMYQSYVLSELLPAQGLLV